MPIVPCSSPAPVLGVVTFDPAAFRLLYPEFSTVSDAALSFNFSIATLLLNNSCCSKVQDANIRASLLNVLVAHLTAINNGVSGQPPAGLVGRVTDATEGSVSVTAEYATTVSSSMAFYIQTKYGAQYWQLTAPWRNMRYVPYCPPLNVGPPGWGYFGRG